MRRLLQVLTEEATGLRVIEYTLYSCKDNMLRTHFAELRGPGAQMDFELTYKEIRQWPEVAIEYSGDTRDMPSNQPEGSGWVEKKVAHPWYLYSPVRSDWHRYYLIRNKLVSGDKINE